MSYKEINIIHLQIIDTAKNEIDGPKPNHSAGVHYTRFAQGAGGRPAEHLWYEITRLQKAEVRYVSSEVWTVSSRSMI